MISLNESLNVTQLKLGNIQVMFPDFQNYMSCKTYVKDNKHNNLQMTLKLFNN